MATLELMGVLEQYDSIFDLEKYKKNYIWNWGKILSLYNSDVFYHEIVDMAKEEKFHISRRSIILGKLFSISRLLINGRILHKIQNIIHH